MVKYKLIGSAATMQMMVEQLKKYFYNDSINIVGVDVFVNNKHIEGFRVIEKGNRVRFELIIKS